MSWITDENDWLSPAAHVPQIAAALALLYGSFEKQEYLPRATLALCEHRIAQLNGLAETGAIAKLCGSSIAHEADARLDAVALYSTDPRFTSIEKACLEFSEVYAMDPQAITDAMADAVKAEVGEPGLVVLIEALGVFNGAARAALLWQAQGNPA